MKEVDYIVVGLGIAGLSFAEQLSEHNKSFVVIDKGVHGSTTVSGGVFNPTVLKRFTAAWNATVFVQDALPFYQGLAKKLKVSIMETLPVYRILKSVEEQNNWMLASGNDAVESFLSSEILKNNNTSVIAPFGLGSVVGAGRIDPSLLLKVYRDYLLDQDKLCSQRFEYDMLTSDNGRINYKDLSARHIVFAEGAAAIHNPYFPKQCLVGNKGEYIIIKAPELKSTAILKGPMMVIPLGSDLYKVGATYSRDDYTHHNTDEAREEIVAKLRNMLSCDFEVVDQVAGVRPTVKDRRPLLGALPDQANTYFYNGLGTRGILMAPALSKMLYMFIEAGVPLPSEVDIQRFL